MTQKRSTKSYDKEYKAQAVKLSQQVGPVKASNVFYGKCDATKIEVVVVLNATKEK